VNTSSVFSYYCFQNQFVKKTCTTKFYRWKCKYKTKN